MGVPSRGPSAFTSAFRSKLLIRNAQTSWNCDDSARHESPFSRFASDGDAMQLDAPTISHMCCPAVVDVLDILELGRRQAMVDATGKVSG